MGCVSLTALSLGVALLLQAAPLTKMDRQRVQLMLKQIREDIEKHYYDPTYRGIDLKMLFQDAHAAVDKAATLNEAYTAMAEVVMRLDDSHTFVIPPDRNVRVDYGWRMAMVGDQAMIVRVAAGSDAAAKGLAPGDVVLGLNRFKPERSSLWQMSLYYRIIGPQKVQTLIIRKSDGRQTTRNVESKITPIRFAELMDLIDDEDKSAAEFADKLVAVGEDILIWRMRSFGDRRVVDDAVRKARKYKTLILDLRANGGGLVDTLNAMVGAFFDRDVIVATEKTRKKEETYRAKSRNDAFSGKLIVLVDSESASAAEVFARVAQIEKRGTVIGDRTAGAVMTGRVFTRSVGVDEGMVFFGTMVTVADVRMSDGASLEKTGVLPDEIALPTQADLAAGRDPVLARALALAGASITSEQAGRLFR